MTSSLARRIIAKFSKMQTQNQKGFSLLQVMVVAAIMTIVGLGISALMSTLNKESRSITAKSDFNSLVNTLQGVFNNTSSCLAAFGGVPATTATTPVTPGLLIKTTELPQSVEINVGGQIIKEGEYSKILTIKTLAITGISTAGGVNQHVASLRLVADRSIGTTTAVGGNTLIHEFGIIVTLDADKKIIGCSGQYANYWVQASSDVNDITYMGGKVGIGTSTPGVDAKLDVNGLVNAQQFMYQSDERLKENVREIPDALAKTLKLHGVIFDWKNKDTKMKNDQVGLIAQEVEKVFPQLVNTDSGSGVKSVAYSNLLPVLIEAIKTQQEILAKQQDEIEKLKKLVGEK